MVRRRCPACGGPLARCDGELDLSPMGPAERRAWLAGDFGWFACVACGEAVELYGVPPPEQVPAPVAPLPVAPRRPVAVEG
jgi:hypothetical protein